jgi:hypothetical protein
MRIDRNGTWYYLGSPIGRLALVKLFSTVLRRDAEGVHWLTTPVENGRIEVEDAPFIAIELIAEGKGRNQIIRFRTNVDDVVTLDEAHTLRVAHDAESGRCIIIWSKSAKNPTTPKALLACGAADTSFPWARSHERRRSRHDTRAGSRVFAHAPC